MILPVELQIALRALQRLDRRFLIDTENNRLGGRIDVEADHLCSFRRELEVVALAPGFAGGEVDVVLSQETPDILNVNVVQCLGQQRARPSAITLRWRLLQKRQNALVRRFAVDRLLAGPRTVFKSAKTVIGKTSPPVAYDARLDTHFLGNGTCAAARRCQQNYLRPLHVALRRARCPAARLKHPAYLRLEPNFSCFGNHPSLES